MDLQIFKTSKQEAKTAIEELQRHLKSSQERYPQWVERKDKGFESFTQDVADSRLEGTETALSITKGYLAIIDENSREVKPTKYLLDEKDANSYFETYIKGARWDAKGVHPKSKKKQYGNDFVDLELSKMPTVGHWAVDVFWIDEIEQEKELPKRSLLARVPMPVQYLLFEFLMLSLTHQYK